MADIVEAARALLRWHVEMGVDEAVGASPADHFARTTVPAVAPSRSSAAPISVIAPSSGPSADEAVALAAAAALACASCEELAAAVAAFDGCGLKAGARKTVFADGIYGAPLLVIGEAPGREEDATGKPFVGRAGALLDRMLVAIGRSRKVDTLITNIVYWRPPGNRAPTEVEAAICRPFVERLIELCAPKAILLAGAAPTKGLLGVSGVMRARGIWREIELGSGARFWALPMLHPAFLLRQPAEKRLAWRDLQTLAARLRDD